MPTAAFTTLGCKVNQYETEYVRQGLIKAGYRDAARDEQADLCVVNTCTVTIEGDAKSRQATTSQAQREETDREALLAIQAGTTAMRGDAVIVKL